MTLAATNTHTTPSALPLTDVNRWFPSTYNRGPNWLVWIGIISTLVAVFIKLWTPTSINRYPEAIVALLFMGLAIFRWREFKGNSLIWLLIASIVLPELLFIAHYIDSPDIALMYRSENKFARLLLFLPFAWWIGNAQRNWVIFLIIAFSGFVAKIISNPEFITSIQLAIYGIRVDFGLLNWQHVAMYSATSLIAALCLGVSAKRITNSLIRWITYGTLIFVIGWSLFGIIATQTRATWLALLICVFVFLFYLLVLAYKNPALRKKIEIWVALSSIALSGLIIISSGPVMGRFNKETSVIAPILSGDFDKIPANNIGVRIETWIIATQWIKEQPIVGWGGKVRHDAIEKAEDKTEFVACCIRHFHNTYIEYLIAYGTAGLLLLIAIYTTVNTYALKALFTDNSALSLSLFTVLISVYFVIINLFESYIFFWSGAYITAVAYTPITTYFLGKSRLSAY